VKPCPRFYLNPAGSAGAAQAGWSTRRIAERTFTGDDLIFGVILGLGLVAGMAGGTKLYGVAGGIAGTLIGGCAGFVVGGVPKLLVLRWLSGRLTLVSTDELRAFLRCVDCPIPNVVLLELKRRGEDIHREFGVILDMLSSEEVSRRGRGWAALNSAFPELARHVGEYYPGDSAAECRSKTGKLRSRDRSEAGD
jgi:hypothetical protein